IGYFPDLAYSLQNASDKKELTSRAPLDVVFSFRDDGLSPAAREKIVQTLDSVIDNLFSGWENSSVTMLVQVLRDRQFMEYLAARYSSRIRCRLVESLDLTELENTYRSCD